MTTTGSFIQQEALQIEKYAVLNVANQHVMISHQHVEAISTTKQEANRKQKVLVNLASARRIGFEMSHQTCLATKQPNLFDY